MKNLQNVIRIFHSDDACGGIVNQHSERRLTCAECRRCVGYLDPQVLDDLIYGIDRATIRT